MSIQDFDGKVALVTGASKGIGAGIAEALGQAGAKVAVACAHDRDGAERVSAKIQAAGGSATVVRYDLARTVDIEAMVAKTVATFGPIQILVIMLACSSIDPCRRSLMSTFTRYLTLTCSAY
jgi:3-oxoacyl-[acyl-carrier protein] reductase